jgi:hypothetical protein
MPGAATGNSIYPETRLVYKPQTANQNQEGGGTLYSLPLSRKGRAMATKAQRTGMQGVYLVAAELTRQGFIVSPTSRSAFGADLLVTNDRCKGAWSVQVKTNAGRSKYWLLNGHAHELKSDTHMYVLVNLGQKNAHRKPFSPDFYVVPSRVVARRMQTVERTRAVFYSISREKIGEYKDRWKVFGKGSKRP